MYKLRERVSATKNIVFEFCPEVNNPRGLADSGTRAKLTAAQDVPKVKTVTGRRGRRKSTALPKLHSVASAPNNNTRTVNLNLSEDVSLAESKQYERPRRSSVDREVGSVKSNWQMLKEERNWTRGKGRTASQRTRRLYETLEDVNKSIDKMQTLCLEKNEHGFFYPRNPASANFEDEVARIKEKLFPRDDPSRSLEELHRRLKKERMIGDGLKNSTLNLLKRSWLDGHRKSAISLESTEASIEAGRAPKILQKVQFLPRTCTDPDTAEHLDEDDAARLKKEATNNLGFEIPSTRKVEELLASMKIKNCEYYEDDEEYTREGFDTCGDLEGIVKFENIEEKIAEIDSSGDGEDKNHHDVCVGNSRDNVSGIKDEELHERRNRRTTENEEETFLDGETFLKIALDGSKGRVPEHFRSQIIKSSFLQRDFKPV